jgi:peptidoglycan biosynthesis protein MviN/MurJ (putative lipid II flippase)
MLSRLKNLWNRPNIRSIIILTSFLFLSRIFGFVRIALISTRMEPVFSDLLLASTKIPETITSLLIMGTISSTLIPVSTRISKRLDDDGVSRFLSVISLIILCVLTFITFLCFVFTPELLRLTTSSQYAQLLDPNQLFGEYVLTTRILLIGPILFALQALFGVFLHIKHQFFVYSWAGAIYNIGTILGILIGITNGYIETAIGMTCGAGVTTLLFFLETRKYGYRAILSQGSTFVQKIKNTVTEFKPDILMTVKTFVPRIFLINGAIMANLLINTVAQNPGQITAFDIGLSIQGLFFSLVTSAGTVVFPDLAQSFNFDIRSGFWKKLKTYIRHIAFISLIGTVITLVCAPIVIWLFTFFGKSQSNGEYIVLLARISTLSLVFQAIQEVLSKYFYVRERVWQPVIISVIGVVSQIICIAGLLMLDADAGVAVSSGLGIANILICICSLGIIMYDKRKDALQPQ